MGGGGHPRAHPTSDPQAAGWRAQRGFLQRNGFGVKNYPFGAFSAPWHRRCSWLSPVTGRWGGGGAGGGSPRSPPRLWVRDGVRWVPDVGFGVGEVLTQNCIPPDSPLAPSAWWVHPSSDGAREAARGLETSWDGSRRDASPRCDEKGRWGQPGWKGLSCFLLPPGPRPKGNSKVGKGKKKRSPGAGSSSRPTPPAIRDGRSPT